VTIAFLEALCAVNGIQLAPQEIIDIAYDAEKNYVGVSIGKLDQSCEVLSKKDHLLYLDTRDDSYELIPVNPSMKPWKIAIFFSGLEHSLAGSKYNMRVD
jgi:galactokinase/galacturonokinase